MNSLPCFKELIIYNNINNYHNNCCIITKIKVFTDVHDRFLRVYRVPCLSCYLSYVTGTRVVQKVLHPMELSYPTAKLFALEP